MAGREYVLRYLRWERIGAATLEQYRQIFHPTSPTSDQPASSRTIAAAS
jgi:hypothetical protein